MTSPNSEEYDVIVVGGGPGGSSAATLVAKDGHRVLLLEKEIFPRYQIGESLLVGTIHGVCRLLGCRREIADASFVPKLGGTFRWGVNPEPWTFMWQHSPELNENIPAAFQVERMKFDEILLRNAERNGVEVRENASVDAPLEEGGRVVGVRYRGADGVSREVRARYVVDASGNRSSLYRAVGKREYSPFFRHLALFGYFDGGDRLPGETAGNILCAAFDEGWMWYIPLSDTLTSVGVMLQQEYAEELQRDPEGSYYRFIRNCPTVADLLGDSKRITEGVYGQLRVRKDFSYTTERFWRPGLALVGDAACFIDPIFSTGIHLATYSALLAARSINTYLRGDLDEARALDEFEERYRWEYGLFHEFLVAFYDTNSHEDSYFWKAKKVSGFEGSDKEAFADLVSGALAEPGLTRADAVRELNEAIGTPEDPDRRRPSEDSGRGIFRSKIMMRAQRGMRELPSELRGEENAAPPWTANGLVPSADHLHWREAS